MLLSIQTLESCSNKKKKWKTKREKGNARILARTIENQPFMGNHAIVHAKPCPGFFLSHLKQFFAKLTFAQTTLMWDWCSRLLFFRDDYVFIILPRYHPGEIRPKLNMDCFWLKALRNLITERHWPTMADTLINIPEYRIICYPPFGENYLLSTLWRTGSWFT